MRNFTLTAQKYINYLDGCCCVYTHTSGARVVIVKNSDKTSVFSLSFFTPAYNDGGIPHILEHCLLAGSEKYDVDDPCLELGKRSLYSYMNAITFDFFTTYIAASYDKKSLSNIFDVYLDAVFRPNLTEIAFLRERNIVYNEMLPVYSNSLENVKQTIRAILFENSTLRFNSAGKPDKILQVSHSDLLEFYENYYFPSNCTAFFYGNVNFEEYLTKLDDYFLRAKALGKHNFENNWKYSQQNYIFHRPLIGAKKGNYTVVVYTVKCKYMESFVKLLASANNSPLYMALVKKGVCDNAKAVYVDFLQDVAYFYILTQNCTVSTERLSQIIDEILSNIAKNGFDSDYLKANYHASEIFLAEKDFGFRTVGVESALVCANAAIRNEDFFEALDRTDTLKNLVENPNYLSKCAKSLINTDKKFAIHFAPPTDIKENHFVIPSISLSDIDSKCNNISYFVENNVLTTEISDSDIVYINARFDASFVESEDLPYLALLRYLIMRLGNSYLNAYELSKKVGLLGGFESRLTVVTDVFGNTHPSFVFYGKFFSKDVDNFFEILYNLVANFDIYDAKAISQLIVSLFSSIENGYDKKRFSILGASREILPCNAVFDKFFGLSFYRFLCKLTKNIDENSNYLSEKLLTLGKKIFTRQNISFELGGNDKFLYIGKEKSFKFCEKMSFCGEKLAKQNLPISGVHQKMGLIVESDSAYTACFGGFRVIGKIDDNLRGLCSVVSHLLTNLLIFPKLRLKGGAYDTGGEVGFVGDMFTMSLHNARGLNIKQTNEVFVEIPNFLAKYNLNAKDVENAQIAALNRADAPKKPSAQFNAAVEKYLSHYSTNFEQLYRKGILSANIDNIREFSQKLSPIVANFSSCTLANRQNIGNNKELFDVIETL